MASIARYTTTYWFAVFAFAMMMFLSIESGKENNSKKTRLLSTGAVIVCLWVLLFNSGTAQNFIPAINYRSSATYYTEDAEIINSDTKQSDSVFIIAQEADGFPIYMIMYLVLPRNCNTFDYSLGESYSENDVMTQNITVEEWQTVLAGWDYLYLQNVDEQFILKYKTAFPNDAVIESKQLYKIEKQADGAIVLNLVA